LRQRSPVGGSASSSGSIPKRSVSIVATAPRFAAKEAVMKALGTGIKGVGWREIEVLPDPDGKPLVYLYGGARRRAEELGLGEIAISLSHSRDYALASAIGGTG
jgi:holo-[acyl-carrier protein] synthase